MLGFFDGNYQNSIFRFFRQFLILFFKSRDGLMILGEREEDFEGFSWFVFFLLFIIEYIIVFNFFEFKNGSFLLFYGLYM